MVNFKIEKAKREDSKGVWGIRNHPEARKVSGNSEEIPFKRHEDWFENQYFKNDNNYCFVLKENNKVIGYCRFDIDKSNDNYIVSIAIDVNFYGKGLGSILLKGALEKISKNKDFIAETKKNNIASIKLFEKNNFEIFKEDDQSYYLKYHK